MAVVDKTFLEADIASVEQLLAITPSDIQWGRQSLETRLAALRAQLDKINQQALIAPILAQMAIAFDGEPVFGSKGIDSLFGASVIAATVDLLDKQAAFLEWGKLKATGPVPERKDRRLLITNTVHGSFGFELMEAPGDSLSFGPTPLAQAVEHVVGLIGAAQSGEDAFSDEILETDPRVYSAVQKFFTLIAKSNATVKVITSKSKKELDNKAVQQVSMLVAQEAPEESEIVIEGILQGILPQHLKFELLPTGLSESVVGDIDPGLDTGQLDGQRGQAFNFRVRVRTWRRAGRPYSRHRLLTLGH